MIGHIALQTATPRVGAAGIMLPNHAAFKVAERFRTLLAMPSGRIDLALGRALAPTRRRRTYCGAVCERTLPRSSRRRTPSCSPSSAMDSPRGTRTSHRSSHPVVHERPEVFVLGSSAYGPNFAAVNGLRAVFAHPMSPEIAVDVLREYRRDFTLRVEGDAPHAAMSVLAFASDDVQARREFEAAWALTMPNLLRGVREPLRPQEMQAYARSGACTDGEVDNSRMVVGEPMMVVERLLELKAAAQADEIVVDTPGLGRVRRADSFTAIADGWRIAA